MIRVYIKRKNEIAGHVFIARGSVQEDLVAILHFGFVREGLITEEEWAKSQQTIKDKFGLEIVETEIDGRTKCAKNMKHFSWLDILKMKQGDTFKPMGYLAVSNIAGMEIEISTCGGMVRYRWCNKAVSEWIDIHFDEAGEPYFIGPGSKKYYLQLFMKF